MIRRIFLTFYSAGITSFGMISNVSFSLYAVEAKIGVARTGVAGRGFHSFLSLCREREGKRPESIREFHYILKADGLAEGQKPYMHGVIYKRQRNISKHAVQRQAEIPVTNVSHEWAKVVRLSEALSELKRPLHMDFDPKGTNCRAGVKAVINGLGYHFKPAVIGSKGVAVGLRSQLVDLLPADVVERPLSL